MVHQGVGGLGINSYGQGRFVKFGKSVDVVINNLATFDPYYTQTVYWGYYSQEQVLDLSKYRNNVSNITTVGDVLINNNIFLKQTVTIPYISAYLFGSQDFCVEFYSYFTGTGGEWRYIRTKWNTPWTNTPNFGAQNWANFGIVRDGIAWDNQLGGILTDGWYHYALTRQSGTIRFFRNGQLISSGSNNVNYDGIGDGIQWNFTRCEGNQALRITVGHCRYNTNFSLNSINLFPDTYSSYIEALDNSLLIQDNSLKSSKSIGLQYNPTVPPEALNKRPVYSYGKSFDLLSLQPALWLDANDSSTITTVSGAVSEWRDKSGNNRHATQTTVSSQPVLISGGLSGKNTIHFDVDFLNLPAISDIPSNYTLFIVCRPLTSSTLEYYLDNSDPRLVFANRSNGTPNNTLAVANLGTWNASNILSVYDTNQILCYRLGTNVEISRDGSSFWMGGAYTPQTLNGVIRLGITHNSTSANPFRGYISEFILFSTALSDSETSIIYGYLAHKWGLTTNLPTNHPYKNISPNQGATITNIPNWQLNYQKPKARVSYTYTNLLDIKTLTPLAWYDASDAESLTLVDTNRVSQWRDKSGNNWHANENTASARPTYNLYQQNGLSLISCRGSGIGMTTSLSLNTPYTIVLVSRQQNTGTSRVIQSGTTNALISPARTTHNAAFYVNGSVGSGAAIVGANIWTSVTMIIGGGTSEVWYNNVNYGSSSHGNWGTFVIATRGQFNEDPQAEIAEIIIFNRRLSTEDRIKIQEYITEKWGI